MSFPCVNGQIQIVGTGIFNSVQQAFLLDLNAASSSSISLSPGSLPAGVVGTGYSQTITASGGVGNTTVTYAITSGAIPAGLTFTPEANGLAITGTPTASGTVTFTVTATDSASPPDIAMQTYTLTVNPSPGKPPPPPPPAPSFFASSLSLYIDGIERVFDQVLDQVEMLAEVDANIDAMAPHAEPWSPYLVMAAEIATANAMANTFF